MRFRVLGPLRVRGDDGWTPIPATQQRVVLAVLLVEAGRVVSTDRLIAEIWGERPPRTAMVTVQGYVRRLRLLLGNDGHGLLRTRGRGYELTVADGDVDAEVFEHLVDTGTRHLAGGELGTAVARLSEALDLWRGAPLCDVPSSPTALAEAARLDQRRLAALEDRLGALLDLGRHAEAVDELHRAVETYPFRERLWAQLMLALHRCGRRAEALRAFHNAHRVLLDELGLAPGAELRRLEQAIRTEDPRLTVSKPDSVTVPAQLPPDLAGFTGRETQLRRLESLLPAESGACPPLTVISTIAGMAGVGKTALAVHWAHRIRHRFPDGQLYVNLHGYGAAAPLRPIDALAVFLPALGVPAKQVPVDEDTAAGLYRTLLADKRVLILLDNAGCPDQVRPLLPGGRGCLVLLTSRDRLDGIAVRDGAAWSTLDVLAPAESLSLLRRLLGAGRVAAEPGAATELATLCGHLPLALRIAAANLSTQPDRTIAHYTAALGTGDRLAALQVHGDPQAEIRAAFDYSYAALPADARRLFRLLGLVPGPDVTAEVAAALASIPVPLAMTLLDQLGTAHLVIEHQRGRHTLHDLLRLYAAYRADAEERGSDRRAAMHRLYAHYLHRVAVAASQLYPHVLRLPDRDTDPVEPATADPARILAWLDAERANLVAVVAHAAANGPHPVAWRLADALVGYLHMRMYTMDWQAIAHAGLAAAQAAGELTAQAAAHLSLATLARATGENRDAIDHYTRALELARQTGWLDLNASALSNLGIVRWATGQPEQAIKHYTQALVITRQTGRLSGQATNLRRLGLAYRGLGRLEDSAEHLTAALALQRKSETRSGEPRTISGLGEAYRALGRLDDALTTLNQAVTLCRQFGDRNRETDAVRILAAVHRDAGRAEAALELATDAVTLARDTGSRPNEADALNTLGTVHNQLGRHRDAIAGHHSALQLARAAGNCYTETEARLGLAAAYHGAGDYVLATEYAETALNLARQTHFRLLEGDALAVLAGIHLSQGNPDRALDHGERALTLHTETGYHLGQIRARFAVERVQRHLGRDDAAREAHRAAITLPGQIGIQSG